MNDEERKARIAEIRSEFPGWQELPFFEQWAGEVTETLKRTDLSTRHRTDIELELAALNEHIEELRDQ